MTKPAIYIDDTGTPQKSLSKYDPGNWKSFVAVLLTPKERLEITNLISNLKREILHKINIDEFHFTDIFSGTGQFKKIDLNIRLEIFYSFINIYKYYKCPILIQSLNDDDIIRNQMSNFRKQKIDGFDFEQNEHLCLWLLLARIKSHDIIKKYNFPFEIFVDAGKQKPDTSQKINLLRSITENSEIKYIDSKSDPLMQFIDFIAFTLNRCRWILMNGKNSQGDNILLQMAELANFNALNMERKIIDLENESTVTAYDKLLREKYDLNGNLSDKEVEKIKARKK